MSRRLAAVDIGSNTVHVLVADAAAGRLTDVAYYVEMPGLGPEVARAGRIGAAKTREAMDDLRAVLTKAARHGYEHLVAGATEAVRRAADAEPFLRRASDVAGVPVRLISPELEARLSFDGVASRHAARRTWLMGDLGGGSTELVVARGREMAAWVSLPLGSGGIPAGRLSDPPRPGERAALRAAALPLVRSAPRCEPQRLVMTGGTASNLPLVLSAAHPPSLLSIAALLTAGERLDSAPASQVAASTGLSEARVRALRGGVEILLLLLDFYGLDQVHVSHEGLRHGMLLAYLDRGDQWWRGKGPPGA